MFLSFPGAWYTGFQGSALWLLLTERFAIPWFSWATLRNPFYDPKAVELRKGLEYEVRKLKRLYAEAEPEISNLKGVWRQRETERTSFQSFILSLQFLFGLADNSSREPEVALKALAGTVCQELDRVFGNRSCGTSLTRVNPDAEALCIIAGRGLDPVSLGRQFRPGDGFVGSIWESGEGQYCPDVEDDPRFKSEWAPRGKYKSMLGIPITDLDKNFFGTLIVEGKEIDGFDKKQDMEILEPFAHIMVVGYLLAGGLKRAELARRFIRG